MQKRHKSILKHYRDKDHVTDTNHGDFKPGPSKVKFDEEEILVMEAGFDKHTDLGNAFANQRRTESLGSPSRYPTYTGAEAGSYRGYVSDENDTVDQGFLHDFANDHIKLKDETEDAFASWKHNDPLNELTLASTPTKHKRVTKDVSLPQLKDLKTDLANKTEDAFTSWKHKDPLNELTLASTPTKHKRVTKDVSLAQLKNLKSDPVNTTSEETPAPATTNYYPDLQGLTLGGNLAMLSDDGNDIHSNNIITSQRARGKMAVSGRNSSAIGIDATSYSTGGHHGNSDDSEELHGAKTSNPEVKANASTNITETYYPNGTRRDYIPDAAAIKRSAKIEEMRYKYSLQETENDYRRAEYAKARAAYYADKPANLVQADMEEEKRNQEVPFWGQLPMGGITRPSPSHVTPLGSYLMNDEQLARFKAQTKEWKAKKETNPNALHPQSITDLHFAIAKKHYSEATRGLGTFMIETINGYKAEADKDGTFWPEDPEINEVLAIPTAPETPEMPAAQEPTDIPQLPVIGEATELSITPPNKRSIFGLKKGNSPLQKLSKGAAASKEWVGGMFSRKRAVVRPNSLGGHLVRARPGSRTSTRRNSGHILIGPSYKKKPSFRRRGASILTLPASPATLGGDAGVLTTRGRLEDY